jgi:hypothetical protein
VSVPATQFLADIVPEIGGDLVQVLRLLGGAGEVDDKARELLLGRPEEEYAYRVVV